MGRYQCPFDARGGPQWLAHLTESMDIGHCIACMFDVANIDFFDRKAKICETKKAKAVSNIPYDVAVFTKTGLTMTCGVELAAFNCEVKRRKCSGVDWIRGS